MVLAFSPYPVNSAHYVLSNGLSRYSGDLQIRGENTLSAKIDGVVAIGSYDLMVTAEAPDGSFRCAGHAGPLVITEGSTMRVTLGFQCVEATPSRAAGSGFQFDANECPDIASVVADPPNGCSISLHVTASDPDHKPRPLAFAWSNGMTTPNPILECQTAGPLSLTVAASDGDPDPECAATVAVEVICPAGCDGYRDMAEAGGMEGSADLDHPDVQRDGSADVASPEAGTE